MPAKPIFFRPVVLCICLFLLAAATLSAQQLRYQFKNYTPSDGLPSSETYQVLRDAKNYMWFATDHGVTRFNGYDFETFNLADNSIMGLYEDSRKRVWAYTFSGRLFYYVNGKFEDYQWNEKVMEAIQPGVIQGMYVDSVETVHLSSSGPYYVSITKDGYLKRENELSRNARFEALEVSRPDYFVRIKSYPEAFQSPRYNDFIDESEFRIVTGGRIRTVVVPRLIEHERCMLKSLLDGRIILSSKNGYGIINSTNQIAFKKTDYSIDDVEEVDGSIYLATEKGLYILDKNGDVKSKYFDGIHITSLEKDYEGGLWLTTLTNAVYYLNHFRVKHLALMDVIINKRINILHQLKDTSILAGVYGGELIRYKAEDYIESIKLKLREINSFYEMRPDFILAGGSIGWFNSKLWEENKVRRGGKVTTYFQIPNKSNFIIKDSLLYSGLANSLYNYKLGEFKLPYNYYFRKETFRVSKLFFDKDSSILVGNHLGLWRYSGGEVKLYDPNRELLQARITDIASYQNNHLLLATKGEGFLFLLNDSIIRLGFANGLVSDNLKNILVDDNRIWLASNNGLSIVTINSLTPFQYNIQNITLKDGLLSNEVNSMLDIGDNVVVGTNNGISYIDKKEVFEKQLKALPLLIRSIQINNRVVQEDQLLHLNYLNRSLNISFEALNYSEPGKTNYRYRLEGFGDTSWTYTNNRELQFNPLPYGNYDLVVQAKRSYDSWDVAAVTSISIICKPPFWATTWFWLSAFSLFIFFVILLFRKRINDLRLRQKQQEELNQKINDTEQMALKAQMNPHFIFNSLNSIQQYVIDRDVKGANKFITGFSKLIRQTLEFSSKETITLEEEISYLTTYLELEKARMESGFLFTVTVKTDHSVSQLEIPPLLLQPYVENALRHGIRFLKEVDGVISLSFIESSGLLECIVEDNGVGRKRALELKAVNPIEYQSRGMSLTAERIALLNEGRERKIEVIIEDMEAANGKATGTRVKVLFPV